MRTCRRAVYSSGSVGGTYRSTAVCVKIAARIRSSFHMKSPNLLDFARDYIHRHAKEAP
jgi:hypothetical protein